MLALIDRCRTLPEHLKKLGDKNCPPEASDQWQKAVRQGVPDLLHKPGAAVDRSKGSGMQAEIDDPLEMAIGGVVGVGPGRAVPANRHQIRDRLQQSWLGMAQVDGRTLDGVSWFDARACSSAD